MPILIMRSLFIDYIVPRSTVDHLDPDLLSLTANNIPEELLTDSHVKLKYKRIDS